MNSEIKAVVQKIADTLDNAKYAKAVNVKKMYMMLCMKMTEAPINHDIRLVGDLVSRLDRELDGSQKKCEKAGCDTLVYTVLGDTMCAKHAAVKRRARTAAELGKKQCVVILKSGPTAGTQCKNAATKDSDYCSRHKSQLKKQKEKQGKVSDAEVEVVRRKKKAVKVEDADDSDTEEKEAKKRHRKHRKSILKKSKIEEPEEEEEPEVKHLETVPEEEEEEPEAAEEAEEAEEGDNMDLSEGSDDEEVSVPVKPEPVPEPEIKLKKSPARPKEAEADDSKMAVNVDAVVDAVASSSICKYTSPDGTRCNMAVIAKTEHCSIHSRKTATRRRMSMPV